MGEVASHVEGTGVRKVEGARRWGKEGEGWREEGMKKGWTLRSEYRG